MHKERQSEAAKLLGNSYDCFENGDFSEARRLLNQAHYLDFEDTEIQMAIRACGFWEQRLQKFSDISDFGAQGDYLRSQWSIFEQRCCEYFDHPLEEIRSRLKIWIYTKALQCYQEQVKKFMDPESMLQIGRCFNVLGCYEDALKSFSDAMHNSGGKNARIMAAVADASMLVGEERTGKVLMREALFLEASRIEVDLLEAPVFKRLVERLKGVYSIDSPEFKEWLPVYGALWTVLDVKRELGPMEHEKLKQSIYALKCEIADGDKTGCLTPRLINRYFWLIDYYRSIGEDQSVIVDVMTTIKHLAPGFYEQYLKN